MIAYTRGQGCGECPPLYQVQGVVPAERLVGERTGLGLRGAEEGALPVVRDARGLDVGVEVRLGVVVGGDLSQECRLEPVVY
jgi:hypothetical protein